MSRAGQSPFQGATDQRRSSPEPEYCSCKVSSRAVVVLTKSILRVFSVKRDGLQFVLFLGQNVALRGFGGVGRRSCLVLLSTIASLREFVIVSKSGAFTWTQHA